MSGTYCECSLAHSVQKFSIVYCLECRVVPLDLGFSERSHLSLSIRGKNYLLLQPVNSIVLKRAHQYALSSVSGNCPKNSYVGEGCRKRVSGTIGLSYPLWNSDACHGVAPNLKFLVDVTIKRLKEMPRIQLRPHLHHTQQLLVQHFWLGLQREVRSRYSLFQHVTWLPRSILFRLLRRLSFCRARRRRYSCFQKPTSRGLRQRHLQ